MITTQCKSIYERTVVKTQQQAFLRCHRMSFTDLTEALVHRWCVVTHHKPLQELPGSLQINVAYLHKISQHALLRGGDVLVELLGSVVELFLSLDVLAGDRKQLHCEDRWTWRGQIKNRFKWKWIQKLNQLLTNKKFHICVHLSSSICPSRTQCHVSVCSGVLRGFLEFVISW